MPPASHRSVAWAAGGSRPLTPDPHELNGPASAPTHKSQIPPRPGSDETLGTIRQHRSHLTPSAAVTVDGQVPVALLERDLGHDGQHREIVPVRFEQTEIFLRGRGRRPWPRASYLSSCLFDAARLRPSTWSRTPIELMPPGKQRLVCLFCEVGLISGQGHVDRLLALAWQEPPQFVGGKCAGSAR